MCNQITQSCCGICSAFTSCRASPINVRTVTICRQNLLAHAPLFDSERNPFGANQVRCVFKRSELGFGEHKVEKISHNSFRELVDRSPKIGHGQHHRLPGVGTLWSREEVGRQAPQCLRLQPSMVVLVVLEDGHDGWPVWLLIDRVGQ